MCGILGLIYRNGTEINQDRAQRILQHGLGMLDTLNYRGPDESRIVQIGPAFLGHTRLSIIDLHTGSQPVYNEDGTIAVILNGEIYNFHDLRSKLEVGGHAFKTQTDTEVIVHLYEDYGEDVFSHLNGMFAAVVYDVKRNILLAGRDRMGEKPIVYCETPDMLMLSSEIKALLKYPDFKNEIDTDAVSLYLNCMYVPAPLTIFKGIKKLPPGHYLKYADGQLSIKKYWDPQLSIQWDLSLTEIQEHFVELFENAVKIRLISDVPIGVFLSGGIDSSAVTAFMSRVSTGSIKTFTVGFVDEIDERPFAKLVSDRYKTDHTEILISDKVEDVFENVIGYFDEPFGDSSAIPTHLVSREARKYVKVILTGDGGDELFAGYDSYLNQKYQYGHRVLSRLYKELNRLCIRTFKTGYLERFYPRGYVKGAIDHWLWVRTIVPENELCRFTGEKSLQISKIFSQNNWFTLLDSDSLTQAFSHDLNYYLPDDLLKKVDMASMLSSLECRAPFLDHRLVEFAMRIPPPLKVKDDIPKFLLKKILVDYLPKPILEREKTGFGAPVSSWLNGGLKEMTFDCLGTGSKISRLLSKEAIRNSLQDFYGDKPSTGDFRTAYRVWLLLVLEIWMRRYV